MKKTLLSILVISSYSLVACQSESRSLNPSPEGRTAARMTADGVKIEINPAIDIFYVFDDSHSMREHVTNVRNNNFRFVEGLGKNSVLDLHFGVSTVWDSTRYGTYDIQNNSTIQNGIVPPVGRDGRKLFYPLGHLRPLKAPKGMEASLKTQPPNFVVKGENYIEILRETLNLDISEYYEKTDDKYDAEGPLYEEIFSPVLAAFRDPIVNGPNKGFLRPGEKSHLVLVLLTDGNDNSPINASGMRQYLNQLKGVDNYTVIAIVNPSNQKNPDCGRDKAGPPKKLEELVNMSGGLILDICGNFASQLLKAGQVIKDKTLKEVRHRVLGPLPIVETVKMHYGNQIINPGNRDGWTWDATTSEFIIRGADKWAEQKGAKIMIDFDTVEDATKNTARPVVEQFQKSN